jgi:hypothetical protein
VLCADQEDARRHQQERDPNATLPWYAFEGEVVGAGLAGPRALSSTGGTVSRTLLETELVALLPRDPLPKSATGGVAEYLERLDDLLPLGPDVAVGRIAERKALSILPPK